MNLCYGYVRLGGGWPLFLSHFYPVFSSGTKIMWDKKGQKRTNKDKKGQKFVLIYNFQILNNIFKLKASSPHCRAMKTTRGQMGH